MYLLLVCLYAGKLCDSICITEMADRVLPIEIQLYIMFWAACAKTNDRRKKVNKQLLRIPVCLYTSILLYVNFTPSTGYQPCMKTPSNLKVEETNAVIIVS